jgi:hypothetical protein
MADVAYPPYSPDIAPNDFYLFGTVKKKLEHEGITDEEQFLEVFVEILRAIPGEALVAVLEAWLAPGWRVSKGDGG